MGQMDILFGGVILILGLILVFELVLGGLDLKWQTAPPFGGDLSQLWGCCRAGLQFWSYPRFGGAQ